MLLVFEAFSGIGAQHRALSNLKKRDKDFKFQILNTCDWYVDAIFGYVAIHKLDKTKKYLKYFNQDIKKIKDYISKQNFSLDSKRPSNINNKSETFLRKVYACSKVSNNLIDIKTIDENFLKNVNWNLITYSFPCQDLSIAGKNRGMEKGSNTNSSILWEIERILLSLKALNKLPKFLLMENVIAITYKTNKDQLEKFKTFLKSLNYTSYEFILNALDHDIPQNRKRFFLLSILDKNDNYSLIVEKRPLITKPKDFINIDELEKTNRDNLYLENIKKQISNITERERESLSKNLQKFKCLS